MYHMDCNIFHFYLYLNVIFDSIAKNIIQNIKKFVTQSVVFPYTGMSILAKHNQVKMSHSR